MKSETKEKFSGDVPSNRVSTTPVTGVPPKRENAFGQIIIGGFIGTRETCFFHNVDLNIKNQSK